MLINSLSLKNDDIIKKTVQQPGPTTERKEKEHQRATRGEERKSRQEERSTHEVLQRSLYMQSGAYEKENPSGLHSTQRIMPRTSSLGKMVERAFSSGYMKQHSGFPFARGQERNGCNGKGQLGTSCRTKRVKTSQAAQTVKARFGGLVACPNGVRRAVSVV